VLLALIEDASDVDEVEVDVLPALCSEPSQEATTRAADAASRNHVLYRLVFMRAPPRNER
jgi:hypothetical protein